MPIFPPPVPAPRFIANPGLQANIAASTQTANRTNLHSVWVPTPVVITAFSTGHGSVSAGNLDMGIYDINGNLLTHTGVTSAATFASTSQTITLATPFPIGVGNYYLAIWIDNATDTYFRNNYGAGLGLAFNEMLQGVNTNAGGLLATFTAMGGTQANAFYVALMARIQGGY